MFTLARRVRHLRRYRRILTVLARHGFGSALEYLQADRRLALPRDALKEEESAPHLSPAEHLRLALEELGPTFIKLGQILSTRSDLLPPPFIEELSKLQDQVPPCSWEAIREVIKQELGCEPEERFAWIDPQPLAAASLSQVHGATLADGREVVVKVQRPDAQELVEADLEVLEDLAALAQRTPIGELYHPEEIARDFAFILRNELDFRREGHNADRFRQHFVHEPHLYIPKIYWDYTTARVLVMERLRGIKMSEPEAIEAAGYDRHRVALHAARIIIKEVLEDGFFHADPHPGNYLVMPGEVIGAMDFGMVGYLTEDDRLDLLRLYIATVRLDAKAIVEQLERMGALTRGVERTALERDLGRLITQYRGLTLKEVRFAQVWEELMTIAQRHHLRLPSHLWLVGKTLAMIEGVGRGVDPEFDFFAVSEPFVRRLISSLWLPRFSAPELLANLDAWSHLLHEMPRVGANLLRHLERGDLPFSVNVGANKETLDRLDRVSTRIALSILVSAFILGLALLFPLAQGNPTATLLLIAGFLAALILGLWLLISILRGGK